MHAHTHSNHSKSFISTKTTTEANWERSQTPFVTYLLERLHQSHDLPARVKSRANGVIPAPLLLRPSSSTHPSPSFPWLQLWPGHPEHGALQTAPLRPPPNFTGSSKPTEARLCSSSGWCSLHPAPPCCLHVVLLHTRLSKPLIWPLALEDVLSPQTFILIQQILTLHFQTRSGGGGGVLPSEGKSGLHSVPRLLCTPRGFPWEEVPQLSPGTVARGHRTKWLLTRKSEACCYQWLCCLGMQLPSWGSYTSSSRGYFNPGPSTVQCALTLFPSG